MGKKVCILRHVTSEAINLRATAATEFAVSRKQSVVTLELNFSLVAGLQH